MRSVSRIGIALCLIAWLFLPAIVVGGSGERNPPRHGEEKRPPSADGDTGGETDDDTDGDVDEPTRMEDGIGTTIESFAEKRGLQPRLDDDGSADALKKKKKKKKKKNDEGSDESDDNSGHPDEDEDGDMTPSAP